MIFLMRVTNFLRVGEVLSPSFREFQIFFFLSTNSLRKYIEISLEKLFVDIGA